MKAQKNIKNQRDHIAQQTNNCRRDPDDCWQNFQPWGTWRPSQGKHDTDKWQHILLSSKVETWNQSQEKKPKNKKRLKLERWFLLVGATLWILIKLNIENKVVSANIYCRAFSLMVC